MLSSSKQMWQMKCKTARNVAPLGITYQLSLQGTSTLKSTRTRIWCCVTKTGYHDNRYLLPSQQISDTTTNICATKSTWTWVQVPDTTDDKHGMIQADYQGNMDMLPRQLDVAKTAVLNTTEKADMVDIYTLPGQHTWY